MPVPDVIANVTVEESFVTTLPPTSSTVTTGWVGKATPPVGLFGCVVNTSLLGGPTLTVKVLLVIEMPGRDVSVAVNV